MVRSTDEGDTTGSRLYHVLGSFLGSDIAITYHLRELFLQTAAGKEYQRHPHVMKLLEMRIVGGILRQTGDDTLYMHIEEVVECLGFTLMALMTIGTNHRIAQLRGIVFNTVEHGGIIMGYQIRYDYTNHPRSLLAKTLSKGIWTVVELLGKLLDLPGHLLAHLMAIA